MIFRDNPTVFSAPAAGGSVAFYTAFGIFQITNFSDSSSGHCVCFFALANRATLGEVGHARFFFGGGDWEAARRFVFVFGFAFS